MFRRGIQALSILALLFLAADARADLAVTVTKVEPEKKSVWLKFDTGDAKKFVFSKAEQLEMDGKPLSITDVREGMHGKLEFNPEPGISHILRLTKAPAPKPRPAPMVVAKPTPKPKPAAKNVPPERPAGVMLVTTAQPAIFVLNNGMTESGTLEKLDEDSATGVVKGRRQTIPARSLFTVETKAALYTLDKQGKLHHDVTTYAREGATYEISLNGTIALAKPLEFFELTGLVRSIMPDQSLVMDVKSKTGDTKTITLPPGSVRAIYLGHESEYDLRENNPNEPPKGHVLRFLSWSDTAAIRRTLYVPPSRFQSVSWLLNANVPGPFGGPAIKGTRTGYSQGVFEPGGFEEVVAEWKRSGDAGALKIPNTWTPKWAEDKQNLSQLGIIGRLVNGWQSLPPEHRETIKQLTNTALDIAGKIAAQAPDVGGVPAPGKKTDTKSATIPFGAPRVAVNGQVSPKTDAVYWAYDDPGNILGGILAEANNDGAFSFRCEKNRSILIWTKDLTSGREGKRKPFKFDKDTNNIGLVTP